MAIEVACGNCQGRLLVESAGVVVACPHCGIHLSIPAEADAPQPPPVDTPAPAAEQAAVEATANGPVTTEPAAEGLSADVFTVPSAEASQGADNDAGAPRTADAAMPAEATPAAEPQQPAAAIEFQPAPSEFGWTPAESGPTDGDLADADDATLLVSPIAPFTSNDFGRTDAPPATDETLAAWSPPEEEPQGLPFLTDDGATAMSLPGGDIDNDVTQQFDQVDVPSFDDAADDFGSTEAWAGEPVPVGGEQVDATAPGFGSPYGDDQPTGQADWGAPGDAATVAMTAEMGYAGYAPQQQEFGTAVALAPGEYAGGTREQPAPPAHAAAVAKKRSNLMPLLVMVLVSYASAMTIALLFVLFQTSKPRAHDLESLPDLEPPMRKGNIALKLAPEAASMAPGHTLRLGESQRFGSLMVTPLRVTRGPLNFVYFDGNPAKKHPPTGPALKLWLRFENVSKDQTFSPLDRKLLLTRVVSNQGPEFDRANNFVCRKSQKRKDGTKVLVYDLPTDSPWDFSNQQAGKEIGPGETIETYVPSSDEGIDELDGNLVWRVQFRKGYNPQSFRGVTTLIEVEFHSSEITDGHPMLAAR